MSAYYGRLQGSRGEATRCGSAASGIEATAETWSSVIRVYQGPGGARVDVQGKYGGSALSLAFDADTLYDMSDNEQVRAALDKVRDAMRVADELAQNVAKERGTA